MSAINAEASAISNSLIFKYKLNGLQMQQAENKAAVDTQNELLKGEEAKGTATAAAATAGVEGNSVQQLLQSFDAVTGHNVSAINLEKDNQITQGQMENTASRMDAQAKLTNLKNNIPQDPGLSMFGRFLGAGLQIGSSYISNSTKTNDGSGLFGRRLG